MSAALHLAVILLLVLRPPAPPLELNPSPADIAMVFQSGTQKAVATPHPGHGTAQVARPPASPPPPRAAPPQTRPPPRPAPPPPAPVQPAPVQPPPATTPPAPPLSAKPAPAPLPKAPPVPAAPQRPLAPPAPALRPPAAAHPSAPPILGHARLGRASRPPPSGFPAPMMRSFFLPSTADGSSHPFSRALADSEAPMARGREQSGDFSLRGADQLGPDWGREFMAWLDRHVIYPPQAASNDEEGDTTVEFTVDQYGRVTGVELTARSGSYWLDVETTGVLRGAHLPPFPYDAPGKKVTMDLTIHYILVAP